MSTLQRPTFIEEIEANLLVGVGPTYDVSSLTTGLYSWGNNTGGALGFGNNTSGNFSSPNLIAGNWNQVSAGSGFAAGIKSDGTLWTWGTNTTGQLGVGDVVNRSSPVQIAGSWIHVRPSIRGSFAFGLKADGTLWGWGNNQSGNLGQGDTTARSSPVQISGVWTKEMVASGNSNLQGVWLKEDGTVWGSGNLPVVGVVNTPVQLLAAAGWKNLAGGDGAAENNVGTFFGLKNDNTLWAWGRGSNGSRGDGSNVITAISSPVLIPGIWTQISFGGHGAGIKSDGTLWTWGFNGSGQLGLGDVNSRSSPTQVPGTWAFVSCGQAFTLAVKTDGTLWAWGDNSSAQLSQASAAGTTSSPIQVPTGTWQSVSASDVLALGKK